MITQIDHIGIYVHDLEREIRMYEENFGLKAAIRGTREDAGEKFCFIPINDMIIELIQPIHDNSQATRILAEKGPCIGHIAYRVENMSLVLSSFHGKGLTLQAEKPRPGGGGSLITFLDEAGTGGIKIGLVQRYK